ncbi:MAG: Dam family site-specific DNA-(adenine-N6)-methyltransferase [bacterium]|nr:Dam family site-specific DNA-(adenine-N6)-methyltransferase [bacterium]
MSIPHPIPYQGSKRHLAEQILACFPVETERLIEPFAGSAAVSLAALARFRVGHVLLNDINAPLIHLWQKIVYEPETLASEYETLWNLQLGRERTFYDAVRFRFNRTHRPHYFLYLLARCVKASVRYNADGEFNQSPDNRRKGRQPSAMRRDLRAAAALLKGRSTWMSGDYRKTLALARPDDLVYLDPPYQGVCANRDPRYIEGVAYEALTASLFDLNRRCIPFILSYDGKTGQKKYGLDLPDDLGLQRIELQAGRSSQATLLGRSDKTVEALYLSPVLQSRLEAQKSPVQLLLFGALE